LKKIKNKITGIEMAIELIEDGDNLTISGFGPYTMPMALVREIIRQSKKNLELTSIGEALAADMLVGAGCIKKIRMSNYMFEGYGRCYNFSRGVEQGTIQVEDYSHFGITNRLFAGAIGVPFMPTKVMLGSDVVKVNVFKEEKAIPYNFKGEKVLLLPAVKPDVAIIHAARADREGNVQLFGLGAGIDQQVRASKKVIVSVEEIVESGTIKDSPELTIIPSFMVDALVEVPYGGHPGGIAGYYDYDDAHFSAYWQDSRDNEKFKKYLKEYIFGCESHWDYLRKVGFKKLFALRVDPYFGYSLQRGGK